MTTSPVSLLLEVLQAAGIPINDNTVTNVRKVVDADLGLVVSSWIDLAHRERTVEENQTMSTPNDQFQTVLRQYAEPVDKLLFALQGDLGALAAAAEEQGSEEEAHFQAVYNQIFDLRLDVKSFFETWIN